MDAVHPASDDTPVGPAAQDTLRDGRTDLPIFVHSSLDDLRLTPNAFRVYGHIVRRLGRKEYAWPSYKDIGLVCFAEVYRRRGKEPNLATLRRMAIDAVNELEESGLIRRERQRGGDGRNMVNHYVVTPQSEWRGKWLDTPSAIAQGASAIAPSLCYSTPLMLLAPEGTPCEGAPCEGAPVGESARPPAHPAVLAYSETFGRMPNKEQRAEIAAKVDDLERWREVLRDWRLHEWNPRNVADMLGRYAGDGRAPGDGKAQQRKPITHIIDPLTGERVAIKANAAEVKTRKPVHMI